MAGVVTSGLRCERGATITRGALYLNITLYGPDSPPRTLDITEWDGQDGLSHAEVFAPFEGEIIANAPEDALRRSLWETAAGAFNRIVEVRDWQVARPLPQQAPDWVSEGERVVHTSRVGSRSVPLEARQAIRLSPKGTEVRLEVLDKGGEIVADSDWRDDLWDLEPRPAEPFLPLKIAWTSKTLVTLRGSGHGASKGFLIGLEVPEGSQR